MLGATRTSSEPVASTMPSSGEAHSLAPSKIRALVVGYGSIGRRHAEVLQNLGCDVALVSRRADILDGIDLPGFSAIALALNAHTPDYVVIANETARHRDALTELANNGFTGRVLVEKPLFTHPESISKLPFAALGVGYNLRFHPAVQAFKRALNGRHALTVEASVGQYLPEWRPGSDYRQSYSASTERGGGVLRDLSHEIDLLLWLFGTASELTALGGRVSALEIESDDAWSVLIRQARSSMTCLHLDYLHRPGRRLLSATTADISLDLDLIAGTLMVNGDQQVFPTERNTTIAAMHTAMLGTDTNPVVCDLAEATAVLDTISAVERSAAERVWTRP